MKTLKGGEGKMGKRRAGDGDIMVKVARTGSKAVEVALNGERSVSDALKAAGISKKESETVNVNGTEVDDLDLELEDGDKVVLVKNIEGGAK